MVRAFTLKRQLFWHHCHKPHPQGQMFKEDEDQCICKIINLLSYLSQKKKEDKYKVALSTMLSTKESFSSLNLHWQDA
jgi:hypothetical protein